MNKHRFVSGFVVLIAGAFFWQIAAQGEAGYQTRERTPSQQGTQQGTQGQPSFTQLDRDKDGYLSREEAQQLLAQQQEFSNADINGDGRLSEQEFEKAVTQSTASHPDSVSDEAAQEVANEKGVSGDHPDKSSQAEKTSTTNVEQQQADVTVAQPAPKVIVEQPTPKVIVKQPEPEVTIQQDEPEVIVKQPEQPEVILKQEEQPEVRVIEETAVSSEPANPLYKMEVGDVVGKDVITVDGETIGEIEQIVLHSEDEQLYIVVPVGGFLGIGEKEVVVPVSQLELRDDKIQIKTAKSEDQLEQQPAYDPQEYVTLEETHTIGQFADSQPSR